jgi:hypothetical protein
VSRFFYPMPASFGFKEGHLNLTKPRSIQQSSMPETISRLLLLRCHRMDPLDNANRVRQLGIGINPAMLDMGFFVSIPHIF